jgi:hypothetical protein
MLHRRVASLRLSGSSRLILALIAMANPAAAQTPAESQPSQQEILQELAVTQRLLADEEFIAGDREKAKADYLGAEATLGRLSTDGGFLTDADIQLFKDELDYRKLLLERRASFWGLQFAARPVNPVAAVDQFEATYSRFKELVIGVSNLDENRKAGDKSGYQLEDRQIQTERDQRVAELQQGIANVRLADADVRRSMYQDRKGAIQASQATIVAEIGALEKQVADRTAAMNATLTSAMTQAVGLPPDTAKILQGAANGDYSGVVAAAVQQYAASPDVAVGLPRNLKELAASAQEAAQRYEEVRKTVVDVQERANQGTTLLKAIQSNDRDKLVAIGLDAMGRLSPDTRDQLLAGVAKVKDLDGALKLAGNGTFVRAEISAYIGATPDLSAKVGSLVATYLKPQDQAFAWRYQQLLIAGAATAKTAAEQSAVFGALSHGWARSLVRDVLDPQGSVVATAQSLGSPCTKDLDCADWLIDHVTQNGLTGQIVAISAAGDVTITVKGQVSARFSVADLAKATSGRAVEAAGAAVRADIDALVARIQSGGSAHVVEVVRRLPDVDFDRDIQPLLKSLPAGRGMALLQTLTSPGAGGVAAPASQDMAALALGRDIAQKTIFAPVPNQTGPPRGRPAVPQVALPAGAGADPSQEMILSAMKASGPYGIAAATTIELLSGISQNGVAIEQINAKAQEDRDLTVEMMHVTVFESDLNRDEAIATLEQRIATAQYSSAHTRSDLYEQAMVDQGGQNTALQAKIRRRLPLIFLLSEQLREQFDALDHALGFWENDLSPDGTFLERSVRSDPQLRRLGLDPDISLYDWFKRDVAGQRKDLDALLVHWQGIEALITTDLCPKYHCSAKDAQMGQVEITDLISLRKLVGPASWAAAEKSRSLLFTILPQSLPNIPARNGLRLVHVAGAVSKTANNYQHNPNIVLRHSGLGYVSAGGRGYRETLDTSGDLTPRPPVDDGGSSALQEELQGRWAPNPTLRPLEGYPLYGLYSVQFPPEFDFMSSDLVLRFYYQWPVNAAVLSRRDLVVSFSCSDGGGRQVPVASTDVKLLVERDEKGRPTLGAMKACTLLEAAQ